MSHGDETAGKTFKIFGRFSVSVGKNTQNSSIFCVHFGPESSLRSVC
jgi:hypothetical protein